MTTVNTLNPLTTSHTRAFLIEGRAKPSSTPSYESCMMVGAISQNYGALTRIECPDPYNYGKFIEVGQIRGASERATTTLTGRYARDLRSTLMSMAMQGCSIDVQLHMGACKDPSSFNVFEKAVILENVDLTNYSTDDLGALASGDDKEVNEKSDVSAEKIYEVVPLTFGEKAASIVSNEILDVIVGDSPSCGDCGTSSDGCQKVFAISKSAGGSPSTSADVVFSLDKGTTWYAHDVDSLGAAEDPNAIGALGEYLIVVSNASNSQHYALISSHDGLTDPTWTEVATGYVSGGEPNAIWTVGNIAWIVGDTGYIYSTTDATAGVTVIDSGSATVDDLLAVHGYSPDFVVAVGRNGTVVYTENGSTFAAATRPVGAGVNLTTVWVKSKLQWFVGTSTGRLFYTENGGVTWTEKGFSGSGTGVVRDIKFSTPSVGYLSHSTTAPRGRILRTFDGGHSWVITPEKTGQTLPLSDRITALAVCDWDANFVVGGGLGDNGADGILVVGA